MIHGVVYRDGIPRRLRYRELEILIALAVTPISLSAASLARRCWPHLSTLQAEAALRTTIHRLRKSLGDAAAVVHENGYRLREDVRIDLIEYEALITRLRGTELTAEDRDRLEKVFRELSVDLSELNARWRWFRPVEARLSNVCRETGALLAEDQLRRRRPYETVAANSSYK
ncbi:MAG: hypothetical protein JO092_00460 [Candidatus Eremiobacteraeota bacterium]|nr:hypothetical protein [Candidatus Eremiobacteraeota bacterium]